MTRDEHKELVNKMLAMVTPEKQADASALLTQLSDDYEETLTNYETASTNVTKLTENNERLREVNAELFLKVGRTSTKENTDEKPETGGEESPELNYESLFNEKGELL